MLKSKWFVVTVLSAVLFIPAEESDAAKRRFITIGTGGVTGVYYPTGGNICRLVNQGKRKHGIRCNVEATGGSVYNVNSLSAGNLDIGIVQSDVVFKAKHGEEPFKKPLEELRTLFSIYYETLALVARKDAKIKSLMDIKGKRVNIGNPGSGQRRTTTELFDECGIKESDLALAGTLKAAEMPDALRDKKLDAYFYSIAHPTANIQDIATSVDINIVPITGACVDRLVQKKSYYVKTDIPGKIYRGVDHSVPTFGFTATLMTTKKLDDDVVDEVLSTIYSNLKTFKELHPAYRNMTPKTMVKGITVPLHPAAKKFFKKKGLL